MIDPRASCARCLRPVKLCWCEHLTTLDTKTRVVLLQHPKERDLAIGTARVILNEVNSANPSQNAPRRSSQGWDCCAASDPAAGTPWRNQLASPDNQTRRLAATSHHTEKPSR